MESPIGISFSQKSQFTPSLRRRYARFQIHARQARIANAMRKPKFRLLSRRANDA
jgi:hypothetical protein